MSVFTHRRRPVGFLPWFGFTFSFWLVFTSCAAPPASPPASPSTYKDTTDSATAPLTSAADIPAGAREPRRHIQLDGQDNFRDLGGYATTDGRHVKWGLIYRSGQLSKLSDADVAQLRELGIRTVVDFRGDDEVATRGADRLPPGARAVHLPIDIGSLLGMEKEAASTPNTGADKQAAQISTQISMDEMTRRIMLERTATYARLMRELADARNLPLVLHCTAGKDRAGVGAALVLTLLGVPWETVREDYLLSNYYRRAENERDLNNLRQSIAKARGIEPAQVDVAPYERMYLVEAQYLDAARAAAVAKYGSMDNYLREGLGVSDAQRERMRQELLE